MQGMHRSHTNWRPRQPETPVELIVSPSNSYDGSVYNKGSSMIENKADWHVNRYLHLSVGMLKKKKNNKKILV